MLIFPLAQHHVINLEERWESHGEKKGEVGKALEASISGTARPLTGLDKHQQLHGRTRVVLVGFFLPSLSLLEGLRERICGLSLSLSACG